MSITKTMKKLGSLIGLAMLWGPSAALAAYDELNMTESVTVLGKDIYDLHMLVLWLCTIVGIGVFAVIIWFKKYIKIILVVRQPKQCSDI